MLDFAPYRAVVKTPTPTPTPVFYMRAVLGRNTTVFGCGSLWHDASGGEQIRRVWGGVGALPRGHRACKEVGLGLFDIFVYWY